MGRKKIEINLSNKKNRGLIKRNKGRKPGQVAPEENRCKYIKSNGEQCVQYRYKKKDPNNEYCYLHTISPGQRKALASKGGKKTSLTTYEANQLHNWKYGVSIKGCEGILEIIADLVVMLKMNKIDIGKANAINNLLQTALKTIEIKEVVSKLEKARQMMEELERDNKEESEAEVIVYREEEKE